ncbi:uncharacterized protein LOC108193487 isoform X3 [Daucus carota subsp. sativus]|uniref:uncharacterized protein LOC108193487 isoform X3 n=1 Tax=Daucus carota subsp. sativus TaxID=79200 RepID=UPI0030831ED7
MNIPQSKIMGVVVEGDLMKDQFINFYQNLLGKKDQSESIEFLEPFLNKQVPPEMCADMVKEVSDDEIKEVFFSMGDDKASGPDGFSARFYKSAWPVIGPDVCNGVKEFFSSGKLLKEVNATLIALIPKVKCPSQVSEFRPIALCNVLYKGISKILANRIKGCLNVIIDENQNAFLPGRRISDNILLTQELFRNYHRQRGASRCLFKVDIKKAYDSVIFWLMRLFGFPDQMVRWIEECLLLRVTLLLLKVRSMVFLEAKKGSDKATRSRLIFSLLLCRCFPLF